MAEGLPLDLPYRTEYAKTGRGSCKGCKSGINKDELKLAFMVQSRFHDGKDAWWFHVSCFFAKYRPKSVGDISHFEQLRWNDQEMLKKKIGTGSTGSTSSTNGKSASKASLKDYVVGYAKSAASTCQACDEKIPKAAVRISKKDYESDIAMMYNSQSGLDRWHHLDCFVKIRLELGFFESAKMIPGFKDLDKEHKDEVLKKLPAIKPTAAPSATSSSSGKHKLDEKSNESSAGPSKKSKKAESNSVDFQLKKQLEQMYKYRDSLEGYTKSNLHRILSKNKQEIPVGTAAALERITDIMTFGTLKPCTRCKDGQMVFRSGVGYQCLGYISEYTKCMNITDDPERVPFKVPNDFRELEPFTSYKFKPQKRIIRKIAPTETVAREREKAKPKLVKKPLKDFNFFVSCADKEKAEKWTNKIQAFGGKVLKSKTSKVVAVITTKDEMAKKSADIKWAEKKGVPVLKGEFAATIQELNYSLTDEMAKYLICDWVGAGDITALLRSKNGDYEENAVEKRRERGKYEKTETSVKLKMKDGAVVDPDSELEDVGHVLKDGKTFYNCVLNRTSIEEGKNSFYKQQIIESDKGHSYWVFQAWGRIGTTIGGSKVHDHVSKTEAIEIFTAKFHELTANEWGSKFTKKPGKYTQLELDFGEKQHLKLVPSTQTSKLAMPVQELVSLIFDVDRMKKAMMEFELNLEEMPLGKISRKQVLRAYSALSEASDLIGKVAKGNSDANRMVLDVSNRFYTMIPHNFGTRDPPVLNNDGLVKSKMDMLESLLEIELAYEMLLEGDKGGENSIDSHFKTLDAAIDPVESGSEEYVMLEKYLKNTHADTHSSYALDVEHIFKVNRKGENQRYNAFKKLHNRKLLWHGSRVTNYAGILSQGLRIAPPEAPATGYMFGKGVYFADMVSKSANYCHTSRDNSTGLLLVCEVALGDMCELKSAKETLTKAPKNCHSVKGLGKTEPNPTDSIKLEDGVEVPLGQPITSKVASDLLYNEYIVYDVAQVNIRYLMKVNFNFSGRRR